MSSEPTGPYDEKAWVCFRRDLKEVNAEMRTKGVIYFDSDDDCSFEFPLRNFYLPHVAETDRGSVRFGLFLGWKFGIDTARSFLDAISGEADIMGRRFVNMNHQGGGHMCICESFLVTPVRLRAEAISTAEEIALHYWFSNLNLPSQMHRDSGLIYDGYMALHGITVDEALARTDCMMESIYPIDATPANMRRLASDPDRHRHWIEPLTRNDVLAEGLCLFLISDNCD